MTVNAFIDRLLLLFNSGPLPPLIGQLQAQVEKYPGLLTSPIDKDDLAKLLSLLLQILTEDKEKPAKENNAVIAPAVSPDYEELNQELETLKLRLAEAESKIQTQQAILETPVTLQEEGSIPDEIQERLEEQKAELNTLKRDTKILTDGLIKVRDQLERPAIDHRITHEQTVNMLLGETEKIFNRLDILLINDVGVPFDNKVQVAAEYVATDDPAKDLVIASSVMTGYRQGQDIVRPQEVIIFKYQFNPE